MRKELVLIGMVFTLTGCETEYGMSREAELQAVPDLACVRSALDSIDELKVTDERIPSEGILNQSTPGLHRFRYECDNCFAYLTISVDTSGHVQFTHDRLTINERPSSGEIRRTREMMKKVELSISKCGFGQDLASIAERCVGIECE